MVGGQRGGSLQAAASRRLSSYRWEMDGKEEQVSQEAKAAEVARAGLGLLTGEFH